jgi:hypothetical protein
MAKDDGPTLTRRALNRATLARQDLLARTDRPVLAMVEHLVGLQAQTPHTAYTGLWSRLIDFDPHVLGRALEERAVVRMALMRSTIHLVTAADAWGLRTLLQPRVASMFRGQFARALDGVDRAAVVADGRAFVETEPRTFKQLGDHLLQTWPGVPRLAMENLVRAEVPLVQVPPRGVWGKSGLAAHTSLDVWLRPESGPAISVEGLVRRYLGAFGPASVMDAQAWCGLTRLREVFDRLRPELVMFRDDGGRELFDLPDAPRPDPAIPSPVRYLYDYDNILLSHADRTRMFHPGGTRPVDTRDNEPLSAFLVDGLVSGLWRVRREKGRASLVLDPMVRLAPADAAALEEEGDRLLAFLTDGTGDREFRIEPWDR